MPAVFEKELAFANELADRAAEIAMGFFGGEFEVRRKADRTPVTEADLQIEAMIRERLEARFPQDAILGEEEGESGNGDRAWIVDPIDGTKNFADGIQIWGTLIGFAVEGRPVVGVASAPGLGERYEAAQGSGARLNNMPIHVSAVGDVSDALVAYGGLESWLASSDASRFTKLVAKVRRTRGVGDFWGHMLVARGAADVMVERELRTWDTAALQPIIEEAGGRITTLDGGALSDRSSVLATNGLLHDEMVRRFAR